MLFYLVDGAYFKQLVLAALDSAYPIQERIRTTIVCDEFSFFILFLA
jgi:hypothetical protein